MAGAYLVHHGIKGQKWGVRRFQEDDGSLTSAGKERYNEGSDKSTRTKNDRSGGALDKIEKNYDRLHELNEKRRKTAKEHSIERGRVLSKDKHAIAKERGKLVARSVAALTIGTALGMGARSSHTIGLISVGTAAVAAISAINYSTKVKDIRNYKATL